MRNMLALFAMCLVTFAVLGWFLDWYHIQGQPSAASGHQNVNIDIDARKILADVHKGIQKVEEKKESLSNSSATQSITNNVTAPNVTLPNVSMPNTINVPNVNMPTSINVPNVTVPTTINVPNVTIPNQ